MMRSSIRIDSPHSRAGSRQAPAAEGDPPRTRRWSREVAARSDALDLEPGVFTWEDPVAIARSLQRSAEASRRRRRAPYASAMAMLCFYINRAGSRLPAERRLTLERSKAELRRLYGR